MTSMRFSSSRPDNWTMPRPHRDASQRMMAYGPIQPLTPPGWIERFAAWLGL